MRKIESLVVVGSSGVGKTTLVDGLRDSMYEDRLVIPGRYTTRPNRMNDNVSESHHLSPEEFKQAVQSGAIRPHWLRPFGESRLERYGFNVVDDVDDRLRIYSANNAFLRHPNDTTRGVLKSALVLMVTASPAVRERRLRVRSPDMGSDERAVRLQDSGQDIVGAHERIVRLDTTAMSAQAGQMAMQKLYTRLLADR